MAANLAITSNPDVQQMPSIAVNPLQPDHVVSTYMDYSLLDVADNPLTENVDESYDSPFAGIGVSTSYDGGITWSHSSVTLPVGFEQGAANPTIKFDNVDHNPNADGIQNRVYVSFMAATFLGNVPRLTNPDGGPERALGFEANNGIFLSFSDNGGTSWNQPVCVAGEPNRYDGTHQVPFDIIPSMDIDLSPSSPRRGTVYVSWARYFQPGGFPGRPQSTGGSEVYVSASSDGGQTWTVRTNPDDEGVPVSPLAHPLNDGATPPGLGYPSWARPAIGPEGDVYIGQFLAVFYTVSHSTDGGQNFFVPDMETPIGLPYGIGPVGVESSYSLLPQNQFRTQPSRTIVADPNRPGVVYVAEAVNTTDEAGNVIDRANIQFSFSTDYGKTWHEPIVVNDDNGGQLPTGAKGDVTADQLIVRLSIDEHGQLGLVWYDTRNDPALKLLNVYGTTGALQTDAQGNSSVTFGPNFRVTDESFDASAGADLHGHYIGDDIGMAMRNGQMYVAWTDTRDGNQDIYFRRIPLGANTPAPPNDRFESNDSAGAATQLGTIITRHLPRLNLVNGDEDWFEFSSLATGTITLELESPQAANLRLELYDASTSSPIGSTTNILSSGGAVIGKSISAAGTAGGSYRIRVLADSGGLPATGAGYSLDVESLTDNLGSIVEGTIKGELNQDEHFIYLVRTSAVGELKANFLPEGDFVGAGRVEFLDPDTLSVLAGGNDGGTQTSLRVSKDQPLLVHVFGGVGSYRLELTNHDQYNVPGLDMLHFPAGAFPSTEAIADFNRDGIPDVAIANAGSNHVSILLGNGDGTFDAPQQFAVGAARFPNPQGVTFSQNGLRRVVVAGDFDEDGSLDLSVTNYDSSDVSILLGRGDGTFEPQRRYNATSSPFGMTLGDVDRDGHMDLVVVDAPLEVIGSNLAVLLGRGDGTFEPQWLNQLENVLSDATPTLADLDRDGDLDLILSGGNGNGVDVLLGNGDGNFELLGHFPGSRQSPDLVVTDVDGDGHLDVLSASLSAENTIWLIPGKGDGSFDDPQQFYAGQSPVSLALVDWGTAGPDDSFEAGTPDGLLDVIVANAGTTQGVVALAGPPEIVVLPNLGFDEDGVFQGYGGPRQIARAEQPLHVRVEDFDDDGTMDIGVVDRREFFVVFGDSPTIMQNDSRSRARDLGDVVHTVQPSLNITSENREAWYRFRVPSEEIDTQFDQVVDFSGGFANEVAGGLAIEVVDAGGNVRGSGERFRVTARQGEELYLRVYGVADEQGSTGSGTYTLVINTLPQIVAIESHQLLRAADSQSGGPATSIVLTLQGERLDATTAENPANYKITWLGPDGVKGGGDDRQIIVGEGLPVGARPVVYSSDSNFEISSGLTYPTEVQQTISLRFANALPVGNYEVVVSSKVISSAFNSDEADLISPRSGFNGHALVSVDGSTVSEGYFKEFAGLVKPIGTQFDIDAFLRGNSFLRQVHNDLSALLDAELTRVGSDVNADDVQALTADILRQIVSWFGPALVTGPLMFIAMDVAFFDPVSFALIDSNGKSMKYDLQTDRLSNELNAYVEVGRNIELVVIPNPTGIYQLQVADVPASARAGIVRLSNRPPEVHIFTDAIRAGVRSFQIGTASSGAGNFLPAMLSSVVQLSNLTAAAGNFQLAVTNWSDAALNLDQKLNVIAARSKQLATSASSPEDSGGGGSSAAATLRAINQAWDELSSLWDQLTGDGEDEVGTGSMDEGLTTPLLEAWKAVTEAWSDLQDSESDTVSPQATGREKAAAAEESAPPAAAAKSDNQPVATPQAAAPENSEPSGGEIEQNVQDFARPVDAPRSMENAPGERIGSNAHADAA